MSTLFDLVYGTAAQLGNLREGVATGGSATTVIDNTIRRTEDNDYFNGGSVFIYKTTDGLSPQGKYSVVSNYDNASKTLSLLDTLTDSVQAGDMYAVNNARFPLWLLIQKIVVVLDSIGLLPVTDTTTLTAVLDQLDYTLPAAATVDLREVAWQPTGEKIWVPVLNATMIYTPAGTAETLHLAYSLPAGSKIKLVYAAKHAPMRVYNDTLNEIIKSERITFEAAAACLTWYMDRTRLRDYAQTRDNLLLQAERMRAENPLPPIPDRAMQLTLIDPNRRGSSTIYDPR